MKVLGIDPGFAIIGWAVIEDTARVIDYGAIETDSSLSISERLFIIYTEVSAIIKRYRPDSAAIEKLFFARNTTTALDVSKAIGVILLAFQQNALCYSEYAPAQVKQAVTGSGRADKKQMQCMIQKIFSLKETPQPDDAADAVAVALCGSIGNGIVKRMAAIR